jgi:hypothetical protein
MNKNYFSNIRAGPGEDEVVMLTYRLPAPFKAFGAPTCWLHAYLLPNFLALGASVILESGESAGSGFLIVWIIKTEKNIF